MAAVVSTLQYGICATLFQQMFVGRQKRAASYKEANPEAEL
jgi:hypothetical protein